MISYFDTSALVPLVIEEATTNRCLRAWDDAATIVSTPLTYVEVHSALAQAARQGRISESERLDAVRSFETRWADVTQIALSSAIIDVAATLAVAHALRGYDAVHCATALAAASDEDDLVAVSGDRDLLRAWSDLGVATIDSAG